MVGVEVGRIYCDVMTDEGDCRAFFYLFDRGFIAIDENDGDVSAVYIIYCKNSL